MWGILQPTQPGKTNHTLRCECMVSLCECSCGGLKKASFEIRLVILTIASGCEKNSKVSCSVNYPSEDHVMHLDARKKKKKADQHLKIPGAFWFSSLRSSRHGWYSIEFSVGQPSPHPTVRGSEAQYPKQRLDHSRWNGKENFRKNSVVFQVFIARSLASH